MIILHFHCSGKDLLEPVRTTWKIEGLTVGRPSLKPGDCPILCFLVTAHDFWITPKLVATLPNVVAANTSWWPVPVSRCCYKVVFRTLRKASQHVTRLRNAAGNVAAIAIPKKARAEAADINDWVPLLSRRPAAGPAANGLRDDADVT